MASFARREGDRDGRVTHIVTNTLSYIRKVLVSIGRCHVGIAKTIQVSTKRHSGDDLDVDAS